MKRVGLYGGTFDPVHNGHLYISRQALKQLSLDEVWWIPSGNPPHKDNQVTSRLMRYEMCTLALQGVNDMRLCDFEMHRSKNCYSYELLEFLKDSYPDHEFYFIMGEDSLELFDQWKHPQRIANIASVVAAIRSDSSEDESIEQAAERIRNRYNAKVYLLNTRDVPISSTEIRERIEQGLPISQMVPKAVEEYIITHEVYQSRALPDISEIMEQLESRLKPGRYRHTIGVMETAANLAMAYHMPVDKLRLAGLLHDCAKSYDNDRLLMLCEKYSLPVTKAENKSPHLLHAKVGAYLAEHEYNISDPDILDAIRYHTTGTEDMSLTAQIVFVADYIEPNRNRASRLSEIRQMAYSDLDVCTLMILEDTISYLKERSQPMDEATIATYNYYNTKVKMQHKEL